MDHRGHGHGIRSRRPFRLEDCADDAAAVVRALDIGRVVPVGYSMGGPVAQLLWRRHPEVVSGMVLCATAARFTRADRANRAYLAGLLGLSIVARLVPEVALRPVMSAILERREKDTPIGAWVAQQRAQGEPAALLEAGVALRSFDSSGWVGEIDVPVSVVVTTDDEVVSPRRQRHLAEALADCEVFEASGGHAACVSRAAPFADTLLEALASVTARGGSRVAVTVAGTTGPPPVADASG